MCGCHEAWQVVGGGGSNPNGTGVVTGNAAVRPGNGNGTVLAGRHRQNHGKFRPNLHRPPLGTNSGMGRYNREATAAGKMAEWSCQVWQ